MRPRLIVVLVAVTLGTASATAASIATGAGDPAPRVTVVADSVGGALTWMGGARAILARGIELDLEIAACRKLVEPGCVYQGKRPPSALEVIRSRSVPLGGVVVVNVGYNDLASDYPDGLDRVMRALEARGVERVVWVTLRAERASYAEMNAVIERALRRWPQLVVADWSAASAGREEWFTDGLHLSDAGGEAFARFLRPVVLGACGAPCGPDGSLLAVTSTKLVGARASTPFVTRLRARGGTEPYRWSVQGLPRPLRVSAAGVVTGRPRSSGRFRLTVRVSDAVGVQNEGVVMLRVAPKR